MFLHEQCVVKCHNNISPGCHTGQWYSLAKSCLSNENFVLAYCLKFWSWLGALPVHSLVFIHDKAIICYFCSLLVNSRYFPLTSTVSTTVLLVALMVIKHGHHTLKPRSLTRWVNVVSCSYWQPRGGCKASNIASIEYCIIGYHFKS